MGEADCKYIAQIAESNESWETARSSAIAEDVSEEKTSDDHFALREVGFRDCSKVSHIRKDI